MGTILHEGEYILISGKITVETQFIGYSILSHIGINTSKVNYIGSTRHFLTYAVIEDLELPFDNYTWHKFEIKDTIFHPHHRCGHHLILLHHDEPSLKYRDEIEAFIQSKEKEKENMLNNNTFSISNNSAWADRIDDVIFADNMAYKAVTQSVPDKLPDITLEDLRIESSVGTDLIIRGTLSVSPGVIRETRKYQFIQHTGHKQMFDNHTILTMPRGLGRSQALSMLNSVYGLYGGFNNKKPPLKFKLIFGQEHATGRYKTICLWEDGEKTIIHGDNKVTKLPVAQAFAWCYVKRTFGTVSHFKKHVDKRTTKMDGVWYFEGDCIMDDYAQGSVPGTSKKRDIYDAAALAIVTKRYGGLRKLVDEYINKEE